MACNARRDRTARRGGRRVDREAMERSPRGTTTPTARLPATTTKTAPHSWRAKCCRHRSGTRSRVLFWSPRRTKCAPTCRCSAAGIGPMRRRSGRLRPRAPRRARPPQSHGGDRRTDKLVEFTCITFVSLVDNFLHMSVFRTSVRDMSVGAVSDPEAVMAAVDRFEAAKPNSHHPRLFAHWSQITQPLTIKMMGAG
jgi:hypothetical protein